MPYVTPRTWTAGEYPSAAELNQDVRDNVAAVAAAVTPTGAVLPYAGAAAPTGWLMCDGTAKSRTVYASLYAVIGTTYGVGDGTTTFNVPDLRQKLPLGKAASGTGSTLGGTGGSKDAITVTHGHAGSTTDTPSMQHAHQITSLIKGGPSGHTHDDIALIASAPSSGGGSVSVGWPSTDGMSTSVTHGHALTIASGGSSGTDANLPPYVVLNYLIKT